MCAQHIQTMTSPLRIKNRRSFHQIRKENLLARYTKWISSEATYQKSLFVFVGKLVFRKVCMPRPQNIRGLQLIPLHSSPFSISASPLLSPSIIIQGRSTISGRALIRWKVVLDSTYLTMPALRLKRRGKSLSDAFKVKQLVPSPVLIDLFYYSSLKDKRLGENGLREVLF